MMDGKTSGSISLIIIRHGQTPGNALKRYVGSRDDEPLSDSGRELALEAARRFAPLGFADVKRVYVTRLVRTQQTADALFPHAEQVVLDGIEEMDFGAFSGRSADEMADDDDYRAWVDSWCTGACPGGESKAQFDTRVCAAMERFLRKAIESGEHAVYLVAHGGTIMAFLSHFSGDERSYYDWHVGNCEGYRVTITLSDGSLHIADVERI